jgi:hypothetical protein
MKSKPTARLSVTPIRRSKKFTPLVSIDLTEGYLYGFPKTMPEKQYKKMSPEQVKAWCVAQGYPKDLPITTYRVTKK